MSQALKPAIRQCCVNDPVWIFSYSDGSFFLICEKDFKDKKYQIELEEVINIKTQESFSVDQLFGGVKIGSI